MASEEESFVILSESPSLIEPYSLLQIPNSIVSLESINEDQNVFLDNHFQPALINTVEMECTKSIECIKQAKPLDKQFPLPQPSSNLAESFLLGAIDCETMKLNVFNNFPSLCKSITNTEDIQKLKSLIQEHDELKENLQRSNVAMRQQFSMVNIWHNNIKQLKENHESEIDELKRINHELLQQNTDLKKKVDELQTAADTTREHSDDKLKNKEFEKQLCDLQIELSNAIGEKLEFEDMRKTYIDELDCLKVNLVATEELYKNAVAEMLELKAQNARFKEELSKNRALVNANQEEIELVKEQLNIYKNDFELERTARQEIAGEKEQLLLDLKMLQKRNQALIEDPLLSNSPESGSATNLAPNLAANKDQDQTFRCPICSSPYENFVKFETHVNECLERA